MLVRVVFVVLFGLASAGCPPSDRKGAPSTSTCTKVGQTCEVAAGKLGTCVQRDDCKEGGSCFVCQSQH